MVETFGTGRASDDEILELINQLPPRFEPRCVESACVRVQRTKHIVHVQACFTGQPHDDSRHIGRLARFFFEVFAARACLTTNRS